MKLLKNPWFEQVVWIYGYERAKEELTLALANESDPINVIECTGVQGLIAWEDTPQGFKFWYNLYERTINYDHYSLSIEETYANTKESNS